MNLNNCIIVPAAPTYSFLLTRISPNYIYADGKRTQEVDGWKYTVLIPELGYDSLNVKIAGSKQLDATGPNTYVIFDGLEIKPYLINGKLIVSAHAAGVRLKKDAS